MGSSLLYRGKNCEKTPLRLYAIFQIDNYNKILWFMNGTSLLHRPLLLTAPIQPKSQQRLSRSRHNRLYFSRPLNESTNFPIESFTTAALLMGKVYHRKGVDCTIILYEFNPGVDGAILIRFQSRALASPHNFFSTARIAGKSKTRTEDKIAFRLAFIRFL